MHATRRWSMRPVSMYWRNELPSILQGKKGLVIGIANHHSIAWGAAQAFHAGGAELAVTWLDDKARAYVEPLAAQLDVSLSMPLDVQEDGAMEAVFAAIAQRWGKLDFVLHSIAFAPGADLHGRVVDCSRAGFAQAMDISCHSFMRAARLAEPLMSDGGCLLTMSYLGADEVIANYGLMGPVKAALESATRYIAAELGTKGIRAHAISPGPIATRAASGIAHFDELLERAAASVPAGQLVDIADVGALAAFLVSDAARRITGTIIPVDAGQHLRA